MHDALKLEQWEAPARGPGGYRLRRELPELTRQLGILLGAGERLDRALATLADFARSPALRAAFMTVRDDVRAGEPLAAALRRHPGLFSDFYTQVVALGEARGDLAGAVKRIADHLLRQQRLTRGLATAISYPLLLVGVTGLSLLVLLLYVLPQFAELFEDTGVALPWLTEALLGIAGLLRSHGWVAAVALAAAILAGRTAMRQPAAVHQWHRLLLGLPWISVLVRRVEVARFTGNLADALAGGVPLLDALRLARSSVGNLHLRRCLEETVGVVREGGGLADGLQRAGAFPALAVRMIQVGENSGRLDESLRHVAEVYDEEFDAAVKRLLGVLEPVLILVIGSGIALVMLAMISAIQRLNTFSF